MNLIPWRRKREQDSTPGAMPRGLMQSWRDTDTLFDRFFHDPWAFPEFGPAGDSTLAGPRTDVTDSEKEVTVTMELPGVDPKDLDLRVTPGGLTVRGEKKAEHQEQRRNYRYVERQFGAFHRTVALPSTVDPSKVDASYRNGLLTVTVGKRPDAAPKRIAVRNA